MDDKQNQTIKIDAVLIIRFVLALLILALIIFYNPYQPSYFDLFSLTVHYYFGIVGAYSGSFLIDWFGLSGVIFAFCILFIDLDFKKPIYKILCNLILACNLILIVSIFAPNLFWADKISGGLGYIFLSLVAPLYFRVPALIILVILCYFILKRINKNYAFTRLAAYYFSWLMPIAISIKGKINGLFSKLKKNKAEPMQDEEFDQFIKKIDNINDQQ